MSVKNLLGSHGLQHLAPAFQSISVERFKTLLIQDYADFGVHDFAEKQALFKIIQGLNAEEMSLTLSPGGGSSTSQANSSPEPMPRRAGQEPAELLDLDAEDSDDFLDDDLDADAFSQALLHNGIGSPPVPPRLQQQAQPPGTTIFASSSSIASSTNAQPEGHVPRTSPIAVATTSNPSAHNAASTSAFAVEDSDSQLGVGVASVSDAASLASLAAIADPPRIRVIVRKRPLNRREVERGDTDVLDCDGDSGTLYVHEPKVKVDLTRFTESHVFCFDDVFDEQVDNDSVYTQAIRPLIATLFRAGKGTCFAYGQTGSGKTFTMQPLPLRAAQDIFRIIKAAPQFAALSLHVACYEIYGGKVFDLLNGRQKLEVREDAQRKVRVVGLKEVEVRGLDVLMRLCDHSACARSTGSTGANDESSRSHSIMTFALRAPAEEKGGAAGARRPRPSVRPGAEPAPPRLRTVGKLSFIDLAGSERGADTYDNDKQTRLEGAEINKSLLALKECIRALDAEARHIPFRGSKLTEVLRDSFVGKGARTVMIANVSPNSTSCEHTLNTLRYADRVKEIKKDQAAKTDAAAAGAGAAGALPAGSSTTTAGVSQPEIPAGAYELAALLHNLPTPGLPEGLETAGDVGSTAAACFVAPNETAADSASAPAVAPRMAHGGDRHEREQQRARMTAGRLATSNGPPLSPSKLRAPANNNCGGALAPRATTALKPANGTTAAAAAAAVQNGGAAKVAARTAAAASSPPRGRGSGGSVPSNGSTSPARRPGPMPALPQKTNSNSDASQASAARSSFFSAGSEDGPLGALLVAEEELIGAHRLHIESCMAMVREEMELLAQLDDAAAGSTSVDAYIEELGQILVDKAAAVSSLQQQVTAFRRQMRAAASAAVN